MYLFIQIFLYLYIYLEGKDTGKVPIPWFYSLNVSNIQEWKILRSEVGRWGPNPGTRIPINRIMRKFLGLLYILVIHDTWRKWKCAGLCQFSAQHEASHFFQLWLRCFLCESVLQGHRENLQLNIKLCLFKLTDSRQVWTCGFNLVHIFLQRRLFSSHRGAFTGLQISWIDHFHSNKKQLH